MTITHNLIITTNGIATAADWYIWGPSRFMIIIIFSSHGIHYLALTTAEACVLQQLTLRTLYCIVCILTDTICRGLVTALSSHLISYHGTADHTIVPRPSARQPIIHDPWRAIASRVCACARVHDCCLTATVRPCVRVRVPCDVLSVCVRDRVCSSRLPNLLRRVLSHTF